MQNAISILSGGLDSAVSTAIARSHFAVTRALTFDYGQRAVRREIAAAKHLCRIWGIDHRVIELPFLSGLGDGALTSILHPLPSVEPDDLGTNLRADRERSHAVWVPNRNGVFINIAAAVAEVSDCSWIITGFNGEEAATFPDNSREFLDAMNRTLTHCTLTGPKVQSYVLDLGKAAILQLALREHIDIGKLWSCYDGGKKWCGRCEACARTIRAMKGLGVYDPYEGLFLKNSRGLRRVRASLPMDSRSDAVRS